MTFKESVYNLDSGGYIDKWFSEKPKKCPYCQHQIIPISLTGVFIYEQDYGLDNVELVFVCNNEACSKLIVTSYEWKGDHDFDDSQIYEFDEILYKGCERKQFPEFIENLSEEFVEIYNQSLEAEAHSLEKIAGMGYRKALEFLIKDYIIKNEPVKREIIEDPMLTLRNCIVDHLNNPIIANIAERAVWLGNDETHYKRIWTNHDIEDLKKLIDVTVYWIEHVEISKQILNDMPKPNRKKKKNEL